MMYKKCFLSKIIHTFKLKYKQKETNQFIKVNAYKIKFKIIYVNITFDELFIYLFKQS